MNSKIYVIIVTYNGAIWIDKCLSSLFSSTIVPSIIVIDNASQDDTVKIIGEKYSSVDCIKSNINLGFGAANNIGIKKALTQNADYVFLLNQDAWVEKNCIENLIQNFKTNSSFNLLSPFHYNYDTIGLEYYFKEYVLKHYTPNFKIETEKSNFIYETTFVHAAAWMLPIDTLKRVGGFDPLFNHTGEDNDFMQRLLYKKMKAGIVTNALLYHKGTNQNLIDAANNYTFLLNVALLNLKNPTASLTGSFWLFYKNILKSFFKNDKANSSFKKSQQRILKFVFNNSFQIIASRKEQMSEMAYLKSKI